MHHHIKLKFHGNPYGRAWFNWDKFTIYRYFIYDFIDSKEEMRDLPPPRLYKLVLIMIRCYRHSIDVRIWIRRWLSVLNVLNMIMSYGRAVNSRKLHWPRSFHRFKTLCTLLRNRFWGFAAFYSSKVRQIARFGCTLRSSIHSFIRRTESYPR